MRPHVSMLLAVPLVCSACEAREPRVDPPIAPDSGGEDSDADTDTDADADPPCPLPAFARIQPGVFMMGTPADQPGHMLGEDLHEVELTRAFDIAIHETTQAEYVACVGSNPSDLPCDTCPVENLSWDAAVAYANAVSESHGLTPCYVCDGASCTSVGDPYDCAGYRLPTEAEWEYAARAGTDAAFPGGGNLVTGSEHCEPGLVLDDGTALAAIAWYCATSGDTLHPAGTLTPNGWGLTDVCGNVYEWVHDWMTGYADTEPVDPWGPETGFQRLGRGGDTSDPPHHLRLGFRAAEDMIAVKRVGVRLARSAP